MRLAELPSSTAAAVSRAARLRLAQSSQARADYEKIKDLLGREVLDQRFAGMKQALENATDEDRAAVNEMLRDLNDLLAAHARGEDTTEQFDEFMDKHGDFFPENPRNVEELIDALAAAGRGGAADAQLDDRRSSATSWMRWPQQAFGSPELMQSLAQLDAQPAGAAAGRGLDGSGERFEGEQGLGLGDGTGVLQDARRPRRPGRAALAVVRRCAARRHRPRQARPPARRRGGRRRPEAARARAGAARQRLREGRLRRRAPALAEGDPPARQGAAARRRRSGCPAARATASCSGGALPASCPARPASGRSATPSRGTSTRTVTQRRAAASRPSAHGAASRHRRRRGRGDRGAHRGRRRAARRHVVLDGDGRPLGADEAHRARAAHPDPEPVPRRRPAAHRFGRHAAGDGDRRAHRPRRAWDKGTNLHHALLLAHRHFRKHPNAQPVLLIVTDGEPTSHLEPDGEVYFDYPPHPLTLASRSANSTTSPGSVPRSRSSGSVRTRVWPASSTRWPSGSAARSWRPGLEDLGAAVVGSYLGSRVVRRLVVPGVLRWTRLVGGLAPGVEKTAGRKVAGAPVNWNTETPALLRGCDARGRPCAQIPPDPLGPCR